MKTRAWGWFVLVGAAGVAGNFALPPDSAVAVYDATGLLAAAAVVCGVALQRPKLRAPWLCLAAGLLTAVSGDVIWFYYQQLGIDPFPSVADVLYLASYPFWCAGLTLLVRARTPGRDRASLIDAAIITTGVGVVVWVYVLHPQAADTEASLIEQVFSLAYPVADVGLVAVLVRLAVGSGRRGKAFSMLLAGFLLMAAADAGFLVATLAGNENLRLLDVGWLSSYVLWGAAALHPEMTALEEPTEIAEGSLGRVRLAALALASIVGPLVLLARHGSGQPLDVPVIAAASIVLFGLVVARMAGLIRVVAELMRRKGEERFRSLVEHASEIITITDTDGAIRYVSPAVERVWGYVLEDCADTQLEEFVHPDDRERVRERVLRAATSAPGAPIAFDGRVRHRDGSWRRFEATAANLLHDPNVAGIVVTSRDVTERAALEAQLTEQAFHDSLTGLANRLLFGDRVRHALDRAQRDLAPVAVLFIDLDDFKTLNDSLGHAAGDELLVTVAERLSGCLRAADTAARLGGDEFAVLLEDAALAGDAAQVAERVLATLRHPLVLNGVEVSVQASVGVALAHHPQSADELLRNADTAMYAAKTRGKGRFELFEPAMHQRAVERLGLRADLSKALGRNEFALVYQPIVELRTGRTVGTEALLRWHHPVRGTVNPLDFIPLAEETGLIVPIGRWVLEEACRQTRRWQLERPDGSCPYVSVNVSGAQISGDRIVEDVAHALQAAGLAPQYLVVELTESVLMHDTDATVGALTGLEQLGVRIAIDDFGTGYCSMSYLQRFPVDLLKVDRSFVAELGGGPSQSMLTRGILGLAQALQVIAVAEGIENAGQLADLRALGCTLGQGFYLSRPLAPDAFREFLRREDERSRRSPRAESASVPMLG